VEELRKATSRIAALEKEVEELKKKLEEVSKPKATDNSRKRKQTGPQTSILPTKRTRAITATAPITPIITLIYNQFSSYFN
jgi:hypothetical protein